MDRSNFYYDQEITEAELDQAFDDVEHQEQRLIVGGSLFGIWSGFGLTQHGGGDLTVDLAAGVAFDKDGKRIYSSLAASVNLAAYVPGTPGDGVYVDVYIEDYDVDSDPRIDGNETPLNYRKTESYHVYILAGTAAPAPTPPADHPTKIRVARVHLVQGQTQILTADINSTCVPPTPVRMLGGVGIKRGQVNSDNVYFDDSGTVEMSGLASVSLKAGTSADTGLDANGRHITNAGKLTIKSGGDGIDLNTTDITEAHEIHGERVIMTQEVATFGINPAATQGFLYREQAAPHNQLEITKWLQYHAAHLLPGSNNDECPWTSVGSNIWQMTSVAAGAIGGGAVPSIDSAAYIWKCAVNMPAGPYPKYTFALLCPLDGLPHGSKLSRVEFDVYLGAPFAANLHWNIAVVRQRGHSLDIISPDPFTDIDGTAGDQTIGVDVESPDGFIVNADDETYYAVLYVKAGDASTADAYVAGARAKVLIREASGVF